MAGTDKPSFNLDGVTPKVDEPVGIKANFKRNNPLEFTNDLNFSNVDLAKYSKYLKPYGGIHLNNNLNESRAQLQGTGAKWLNGIVKFGGKVGTSFLEPFIDISYGATKAISEGKFSSLFDNEITQGFDEFNNFLTEKFPNYYTAKETAAGTLSPHNWFTANFWADKVLGGAAFTVGTLLNAYATMGIFTALKGTQLGLRAGHNGAKAAMATNKALGKLGKETIDDVVKTGAAYKFKNGGEAMSASLFSVMGEAGLESRELGKVLRAELQPLVKEGKLSQAEADKRIEDSMGTAFAANVAIVGTSQFLQFGKLFQRGYRPNKVRLNKIVRDGSKFAQKLPTTGFGKFAYKTTGARIAVRDMLTEAKEEGLQFLTQKSLEYKYGEELMKDNISSLTEGMKELFTTKEGQENMLIGAILGAGSHFGKLISNSNSEPYNKVRESATGKVVDLLNKHFTKDDNLLYKLVSNAGMQVAATERKEYYLSKDDIFNYKNEEAAEFAAIVKSFADLGALDILGEQIDAFANTNDTEFAAIFDKHRDTGVTKNKAEYIKEIKDKVKRYARIHQSIEDTYADRLPSYRSGMYMSAVAVDDLAQREITIKNKIKDRTGVDYKDFSALRSRQYYERAKEKIRDLAKTDPETKDKPEEKIPTDNKEIFDEAYADAVNEWLKDHQDETNQDEVDEMTREIADLSNMLYLRQKHVDNVQYMQSKKGQKYTNTEEFVKKVNEKNSEYIGKLKDDLVKFSQAEKDGKLDIQELDKRIADAHNMFQQSGNKEFAKLRDSLMKLLPEDQTLVDEADDISSSTGDQTKDSNKVTLAQKIKARQPRNKREKTKQTKKEQVKSTKVDTEVSKVKTDKATDDVIAAALAKTREKSEENPNEESDTTFNSAKRSPVEEENTEPSLARELFDLYEALFDKNSPTSLRNVFEPEFFYDFEFMIKYLNGKAIEAGGSLNRTQFNIIKGYYQALVHATNPNPTIYESGMTFSFTLLNQSVFKADNQYWVTTTDVGSTSTQREEFSREGSRDERSSSSHSTMHASNANTNRKGKYNRETGQHKETTNEIINPNNLNYDNVNVGTKMTLRIPKVLEYTEDGKPGSGSVALKKYLAGEELSDAELRNLPIEMITPDGKKIGMLHSESFINSRIKGDENKDERELQLAKLLQIRTLISRDGEIKTTINRRTNGVLFKFIQHGKKKQITAVEGLADTSLQFAIGTSINDKGELLTSPKKSAEQRGDTVLAIDKDKVIAGITYALLPVNKDENGNTVYIPAPMQSMRPMDYEHLEGEDVKTADVTKQLKGFGDRVVDTVHDAVEIFMSKDALSVEQSRVVEELKAQGYDITNYKGLKKYINNFFYTFDNILDLDNDMVGGPLRSYMRDAKAGDSILNISAFYIGFGRTGEAGIQLARTYPDGTIDTHNLNVHEDHLTKTTRIDKKDFLENLKKNLRTQYLRTNLNNLNTNKPFAIPVIIDGVAKTVKYDRYNDFAKQLLRTDVVGIKDEETGRYNYSINPVIEVDTSFLGDKENQVEDLGAKVASEETKEEAEVVVALRNDKTDKDIKSIEKKLSVMDELTKCIG